MQPHEDPNTERESVYGENLPIEDREDDRSIAEVLDDVRDRQADNAGHGGMGRTSVPRNHDDATQGEFTDEEDEEPTTPG